MRCLIVPRNASFLHHEASPRRPKRLETSNLTVVDVHVFLHISQTLFVLLLFVKSNDCRKDICAAGYVFKGPKHQQAVGGCSKL